MNLSEYLRLSSFVFSMNRNKSVKELMKWKVNHAMIKTSYERIAYSQYLFDLMEREGKV